MRFISWRKVESWECISCGLCCHTYDIKLEKNEYKRFNKLFGKEIFDYNKYPIKYFLKRTIQGSCIFHNNSKENSSCKIHHIKPVICKSFPFLIFKSENENLHSSYLFKKKRYNIYLEIICEGIKLGNPSYEFIYMTIPEVINLRNWQSE